MNLTATSFTSSGNTLVIGPVSSICFNFQQGTCHHSSHHEKEDGEQQLHICQPCFQLRQILVHHSSGNRRIGAISCPHLISSSSQTSVQAHQSSPVDVSQGNSPNQPNQTLIKCSSCQNLQHSCSCIRYSHHPDALPLPRMLQIH